MCCWFVVKYNSGMVFGGSVLWCRIFVCDVWNYLYSGDCVEFMILYIKWKIISECGIDIRNYLMKIF